MAVPQFEKFLYLFLVFLKDGPMNAKELREKLANHFNLTPADLKIKTRSGNTTQFLDRVGWARQYFRRTLFIDIPQQGTYQLTDRAKEFLSTHNDMDVDDLMAYPEYAKAWVLWFQKAIMAYYPSRQKNQNGTMRFTITERNWHQRNLT